MNLIAELTFINSWGYIIGVCALLSFPFLLSFLVAHKAATQFCSLWTTINLASTRSGCGYYLAPPSPQIEKRKVNSGTSTVEW